MLITVFTPTHNPRFLPRLAESLRRQRWNSFEWVIVPNGGLSPDDIPAEAITGLPDVRVVPYSGKTQNIGEIKQFCCRQGRGEILVEADHDDELTPDCLEQLATAFAVPDVDFCYSNWCEIQPNGPRRYRDTFGWMHRPFQWHEREVLEVVSFAPSPASFSRVWYAPNHVRAWRTSFYRKLGGHDPSLPLLDDHDLLARTYLHGRVRHIDKCLYVYHLHDDNTCNGEGNAWIQKETMALYDKYLPALVGRWCALEGLPHVDLANIDRELLSGRWPFEDAGVGAFIASDLLCKLQSPMHVMSEAFRCLAPGGWFLTDTPSTEGRGAFQDPRHISYWNCNSFWYYTRKTHADYIGTDVRFQATRVRNHYPSDWHQQNAMPYVRADLLKFSGRTPGPVEFDRGQTGVLNHATIQPPKVEPRFTILTPTIEREELIRCCRSVDSQTLTNWQHIIIVDAADWSIDLAPLRHPNRVFLASGRRHHDVGNAARNLAFDHIEGAYVIGLDDDNWLLHDRVLQMLSDRLGETDWAVYPIIYGGRYFFENPPGRRRTDLAQMVYRPRIAGQEIRYPRVPDYDADGMLCERLKELAPPLMLDDVGPLVMYEKSRGLPAPDAMNDSKADGCR